MTSPPTDQAAGSPGSDSAQSAQSAREADYAAAGFGHALDPGTHPALVLVDPVRAYTDPTSPLYAGVEDAVAAMATLLGVARQASIPVVITQVSYANAAQGGVFWRKVPALSAYLEGSPYAAIIEGLEPRGSEHLITKQYPSAFFGTPLASHLTAARVDTLLIAGLSTSGCVRATTLDAMQHGFVPIVVEDAVGDRQASVHTANLFDIRHKMGEVWSLPAAQAYLESLGAPLASPDGRRSPDLVTRRAV